MRRALAIVLLAVFGLPLVAPLLALGQDADAGLPACCRRTGKHHCSMTTAERVENPLTDSKSPRWQAPADRCPCCPATLPSVGRSNPLTLPIAEAIFAELVKHPSGTVQTECKWRVARNRSRQKRGPPAQRLA